MTSTGQQPFSSRGKTVSELEQYQDENMPEGFTKYSKFPADVEMNARYEELLTEVLVLRRQLPTIKDSSGKDVTKEMLTLHEQLRNERLNREKLEARVAELDRRPRISEWNDGETSIVSQFTLDRESARHVAESIRNNDLNNFKGLCDDERQSYMAEVAEWKQRYTDFADEHEEERRRLCDENQNLLKEVNDLKDSLDKHMIKLSEAKEKLAGYNEIQKFNMVHSENAVNNVPDATTQKLQDRIAKLTAEIEGLKQDVLKRDKLIRGFTKICGRSLNNATNDDENLVEQDPRKVLVRNLYATLDCLDEFWKHRETLANEVKAFVDSGEQNERFSTINDNLNRDREDLERQLNEMSSNETSVSSFRPQFEVNAECSIDLCTNRSILNNTADITDLQYVQRCYAELKETCQTLFSRLQASADFLVRLTDALQNSNDATSLALLKKIQALKLNATLSDASIVLSNANEAEKSMNATIERSIRASIISTGSANILPFQSINAANTAVTAAKIVELENQLSEVQEELAKVKTELSAKIGDVKMGEEKLEKFKNDVTNLDQLLSEQRRATDRAEFERDELRAQFAVMEEKQEIDDGKTHEALVEAHKQIEDLTEAQKCHRVEIDEIQNALTFAKKEVITYSNSLRKEQLAVKKLTEELTNVCRKHDEIAAERDAKAQIAEVAEKKLRTTVDQRAREHDKDLAKLRDALEKMTQSCNSYDAYLKAVVAKALSRDDDETVIDPPEFIDAQTHQALVNVVSAPKKTKRFCEAFVEEYTDNGDTSIVMDHAPGDLQVAEVIERVAKSKDHANALVQTLKELNNEPEHFRGFVVKLLSWARENRDTLIAVLAHLEAVKAKNEKLVSTIITEMQEISTVLRQANSLCFPKHHRNVHRQKTTQK